MGHSLLWYGITLLVFWYSNSCNSIILAKLMLFVTFCLANGAHLIHSVKIRTCPCTCEVNCSSGLTF